VAIDGFRLSGSMFSVLPIGAAEAPLDRRTVAAAVRWLPAIGALLALAAAVPLAVDRALTQRQGDALLASVLAVVVMALGTRALHLDGLADTADGLGSRAEPETALRVMRQSDIGPFGVVTLVLTLLTQVAALAVATGRGCGVAAVVIAAATGRLAVAHATTPGVPPARAGGFGALVAGCLTRRSAWAVTVVTAAASAGLIAPRGIGHVAGCLAAQAAALGVAAGLRGHAVRRLGGTTGDVFGALVETTSTVTLLLLALVG
jgi:adenosylcobinamide-GDP ribazoletransferase